MQYLLDTNAIIKHFANFKDIGKTAKKIIRAGENNEHQLFISIISLMEVMSSDRKFIEVSDIETIWE